MYVQKLTIWDCGRPAYGDIWDNMGTAPYGIGVEIGRDLADTNPPGVDGMPYGGYNECEKSYILFLRNPTLSCIYAILFELNRLEYIQATYFWGDFEQMYIF